jgi:hypothetical protein
MGRITAFFQRVFKFTYYDKSALERLEGQATFKFRAFWSVRGQRVKLNYKNKRYSVRLAIIKIVLKYVKILLSIIVSEIRIACQIQICESHNAI